MENIFVNIAEYIKGLIGAMGGSTEAAGAVMVLVEWICIAAIVTLNVIILIWLERKISGFIQERLGPNRLGPIGMFQTIADAIKLLTKEDIIPNQTDKWIFMTAPMFFLVVSVMLYAVLPMGSDMSVIDMNIGLLYFVSLGSLGTICLLMAGWGSNNKWSLLGAMRSVAQMLSYELPLVFSMLGVVMIVGSLNLNDIVRFQEGWRWMFWLQPLALLIYFMAATAELNRAPFDMPEAEQELVAGVYTEYSGMRWALFFLAEYTNLVAVSALASTLFLGGWQGPFLPSWLWIIIKTYAVMLVFMWMRWTFPRIRMDHLMSFSWKVLIPASLANLLLTGAGLQAFQWMGWW